MGFSDVDMLYFAYNANSSDRAADVSKLRGTKGGHGACPLFLSPFAKRTRTEWTVAADARRANRGSSFKRWLPRTVLLPIENQAVRPGEWLSSLRCDTSRYEDAEGREDDVERGGEEWHLGQRTSRNYVNSEVVRLSYTYRARLSRMAQNIAAVDVD